MAFRSYSLHDPGAYSAEPLSGQITWRVTQPWTEPYNEAEREAFDKARALVETLRKRSNQKTSDQQELEIVQHNHLLKLTGDAVRSGYKVV